MFEGTYEVLKMLQGCFTSVDKLPFCSNCGIPVDATQKFCPNCGQRLSPVSASPPQPIQSVAPQITPSAPQQGYAPIPPSASVVPNVGYGERIVSIIPNLKKPKSFGRWDTYNLVVTDRRCVIAFLTADMLNRAIKEANERGKSEGKGFMDRWGDQMSASLEYWRRYESMDPEAILMENRENFTIELSAVKKAYVDHKRRSGQKNSPEYWEVTIETRSDKYKFESDSDPGSEVSRGFDGRV